jgi:hypothetical protein
MSSHRSNSIVPSARGRVGATDLLFSELHVQREERSTDSEEAIAPQQSFLEQLVVVLHITERLDLNTRIWTKD